MNVVDATQLYEAWLADLVELYQEDLDYKHERMAESADPFPFFRATYYLWVLCWADGAGQGDAPVVNAVGDLHLENFGSWRDADGRLCWGVNDFDEAEPLPYTNDLIRLATSVRLARRLGARQIKTDKVCEAILDGYAKALQRGGRPFVLEERHRRLRGLAMQADREPVAFWNRLTALLNDGEAAPPATVRAALQEQLPTDATPVLFRRRTRVGMGSLGKPRFVALARSAGAWVAREAKAATPPATVWASGKSTRPITANGILRAAMRSHDPHLHLGKEWIIRRLGPRCSRIDLCHLRHTADAARLFRAMGAEVANVHLGTAGAAETVFADLAKRPRGWLVSAAKTMADVIERQWTQWRKAARKQPVLA